MKKLRLVRFIPSQNIAACYWEEDGFRRNDGLDISSLTIDQQAVVAGALSWAVTQLPSGFEALESVELRRESDTPVAWGAGDPPVPTEFCPAFVASIVGNGPLGQRAVEINSVPGPKFVALGALWDQLSV